VLGSHNVAIRGGHHCAQPLMTSLDLVGTNRAGIGIYTNSDDITALIDAVKNAKTLLS
jgi:cysteine desulfurase/selenocysteine lyase